MSRIFHYLATAHIALAVLAIASASWLAIRAADVALSPGVEALSFAATFCRMSAIVYLLAAAAAELGLAGRYRRANRPARGETLRAASQAALLIAIAAVVLRGPAARLYLVGLDHLLAVVFTIASLSLLLAAAGSWLRRREQMFGAGPTAHVSLARIVPWAFVTAELVLVASLGYLESRPLPGNDAATPPAIAAHGSGHLTNR